MLLLLLGFTGCAAVNLSAAFHEAAAAAGRLPGSSEIRVSWMSGKATTKESGDGD